MNTKKTAPSLNKKIQDALNACETTSSKIRLLHQNEFSRGDISRILKIRYQHVRNVLITPLKNQ